MAGLPLFRGSNRYSIIISALILMFMVSRASILSRRWSSGLQYSLAAGILLFGLFDQLPLATPHEKTTSIARDIRIDRDFVQAMEEKLPPKAMVFQLPVMPYPESTPVNALQAYEHFRPYFFSKTLRFSFGSNKGRPREDWQKEVEKQPPAQMAATLEKYGFGAIYLNRKGFTDQAQSLIKQLADAGKTQVLEDEVREQVCILLNPSATPELPPPGDRVPLRFDSGWTAVQSGPSGTQHWTGGAASLSFFNPHGSYASYSFKGQVGSMSPRRFSIEVNGKEVWSAELGAGQAAPVNVLFDAKSGKNRIRFKVAGELPRPTKENPIPRVAVVIAPQINLASTATK